jgi:hypothetical protein
MHMSVTTSPVLQLKHAKGDRHGNTGEVSNDVQDVQNGGQSTVTIVAVVGRTAGHDTRVDTRSRRVKRRSCVKMVLEI